MKLNRIQQKLCYILACDARLPIKKIAELCRTSSENVIHHMKKLFAEDNVGNLTAIIDSHSIGLQTYYLLMRNKSTESIRKATAQFSEIIYVGNCTGKYDIQIIYHAKTPADSAVFVEQFTEANQEDIYEYTVMQNVDELKWTHALPEHQEFAKSIKLESDFSTPLGETFELSKQELKILYHLTKDPRASTIEIGKTVNLSHETVRKKLKFFRESNILKRCTAIYDFSKFGYFTYLLFFNNTANQNTKLKQLVKQNPNVIYATKLLGEYTHAVYVLAKNPKSFDMQLQEFKSHLPELTFDILVFQNETASQFPMMILE